MFFNTQYLPLATYTLALKNILAHSQHDAHALNPKLAGFCATYLDVPFFFH